MRANHRCASPCHQHGMGATLQCLCCYGAFAPPAKGRRPCVSAVPSCKGRCVFCGRRTCARRSRWALPLTRASRWWRVMSPRGPGGACAAAGVACQAHTWMLTAMSSAWQGMVQHLHPCRLQSCHHPVAHATLLHHCPAWLGSLAGGQHTTTIHTPAHLEITWTGTVPLARGKRSSGILGR